MRSAPSSFVPFVSFVVTLVLFVSAAAKRWVWPVAYDLRRGEGARLQRRNAPRRPFRRRTNSPSNLLSYHMSGRRSAQRGRYQGTALPSLLRRNVKPFRSSVIATPRQPHRASSRYPAPLTPCRLPLFPPCPGGPAAPRTGMRCPGSPFILHSSRIRANHV